MKNFYLTSEEIQELRAAHKSAKNKSDAYRINAIILLGSSWSLEEVVDALFLDDETLRNYIASYKEGGLEKLLEHHHSGGDQVVIFESRLRDRAPLLLALETDLYEAVAREELRVYYQPIIALDGLCISGMEALVRWQHPTRGLISPMDFIPLAEETGLIHGIGQWVLEEACRQNVEWREKGFSLTVAVNLSVKQLWEGNFQTVIENILKQTGLGAESLELELTETQILDHQLVPFIQAITDQHISLSIDDFGTGYSGLAYLKFFDVGKIKIDKSFIDDLTTNQHSATIVCAILEMARALGVKTLAEGVETKEQFLFLQGRGCQFIQGYYFSKPLTPADFLKYISKPLLFDH